MTKALALPEIREAVGQYVGPKDLFSCVLVSRDWSCTFLSLLWRRVSLGSNIEAEKQPSLTAMEKHGHHIRSLSLKDITDLGPKLEHCINLTDIFLLAYSAEAESQMYTDDLKELILRNQATIRVFENEGYHPVIPPEAIQAIMSCPQLTTLETIGVVYDEEVWDQFIRICGQIKRFVSISDFYSSSGDEPLQPATLKFETIRSLTLSYPMLTHGTPAFFPQFISRCPRLQSLNWDAHDPFPTRFFVDEIVPACPELNSLYIRNRNIVDEDVTQVLDAMNVVKVLRIGGTHSSTGLVSFGTPAFKALRRHFLTLQAIHFRGSHTIKSLHIQEVLSSCPNLRLIEANEIWAKDVRDGTPWMCARLRAFRVCIMSISDSGAREAVFEQLSRLQELHELDVSMAMGAVTDGLDMMLQAGLGALEGLKQLRYVSVIGVQQVMSAEDVDWIGRNWRLSMWEGRLHIDKEQHEARAKQLQEYGIRLGVYNRSLVLE